ncbi:hypothetical protein HYV71_04335 [Candidatus Uhrbacteria bacterium]|nr:hypothetical protein [Candidatus Uhrbacteria bacterium]
MKKERVVSLLLRVGLAAVFGYAGVAAFLQPTSWIGYIPEFLRESFDSRFLLTVFSGAEIIVALWLLSGRYLFMAGIISALAILGILTFNLGLFDVVFRDIAIFFAALALAYLETKDPESSATVQ